MIAAITEDPLSTQRLFDARENNSSTFTDALPRIGETAASKSILSRIRPSRCVRAAFGSDALSLKRSSTHIPWL
jgi:hypothetical protein